MSKRPGRPIAKLVGSQPPRRITAIELYRLNRNLAIWSCRWAGMSRDSIARAFLLTRQQVTNILAVLPDGPPPGAPKQAA